MFYLPDRVNQKPQTTNLSLQERLPDFIVTPCQVNVSFYVEQQDDFYLIHLKVTGTLKSICQRCMQEFSSLYDNITTIAVCRDDERAQRLLEQYECIVSTNLQVDLEELIVDELHLYAPMFHVQASDCDEEINQFLTGKTETY